MTDIKPEDIIELLKHCQETRIAMYYILYDMAKEKVTKEDFKNAYYSFAMFLESLHKIEINPEKYLKSMWEEE